MYTGSNLSHYLWNLISFPYSYPNSTGVSCSKFHHNIVSALFKSITNKPNWLSLHCIMLDALMNGRSYLPPSPHNVSAWEKDPNITVRASLVACHARILIHVNNSSPWYFVVASYSVCSWDWSFRLSSRMIMVMTQFVFSFLGRSVREGRQDHTYICVLERTSNLTPHSLSHIINHVLAVC